MTRVPSEHRSGSFPSQPSFSLGPGYETKWMRETLLQLESVWPWMVIRKSRLLDSLFPQQVLAPTSLLSPLNQKTPGLFNSELFTWRISSLIFSVAPPHLLLRPGLLPFPSIPPLFCFFASAPPHTSSSHWPCSTLNPNSILLDS